MWGSAQQGAQPPKLTRDRREEEQRGWIQSPGLPRPTARVSASTAKHLRAEAAHQRLFPWAGKNTVSIPGVCSDLGNIQLFFILRIKASTFQAAVTRECLSEQDPTRTRPSSRPAAATRTQRLPNTATSFRAGPDQITHASPLLTLQMQQIKGKHFKSSHPIRGKAPKFGSTPSEDPGDPYQVTFTRGPSNPMSRDRL